MPSVNDSPDLARRLALLLRTATSWLKVGGVRTLVARQVDGLISDQPRGSMESLYVASERDSLLRPAKP